MFQSRCLCEPFDRRTAKERTAIRKPVRHPKREELPLGFGLRLSSASYRYLRYARLPVPKLSTLGTSYQDPGKANLWPR